MGKYIDMAGWVMKEHGIPDSRITVIKDLGLNKHHDRMWLCSCECGKIFEASGYMVKNGHTRSCGCMHRENIKRAQQQNHQRALQKIIMSPDGIGYTQKGEKFYFDPEDYELIRNYSWRIDGHGYLAARIPEEGKVIRMHRLIMKYPDQAVDHINRNKLDNRKNNLRLCTKRENSFNRKTHSNNTSGHHGVWYTKDKPNKPWRAAIKVNGKYINLGYFVDKEEAVRVRIEAEKKYFKEFAPN